MKIGVFSPGRQFGASTVSMILAEMMSVRMGTPVILMCADPTDWTHQLYLDLPDAKEITRSLRQVSAMLGVKAITGDEVKKYAIKKGEYFSVLNPVVEDLEEDELAEIISFICKSVENDVVIVDANIELGSKAMDDIIDSLDYYIIVLSQSIVAKKKLDVWKEKSKSFAEMQEKGLLYVINNYDNKVSAIREIIKDFEIPKNRTCSIPYSPNIKALCNESNMAKLIEYFEDDDVRTIRVKNSVEEIIDRITADMGLVIGG